MSEPDLAQRALAAARRDPRLGPRFHPSLIEADEAGVLTIEAEVDSVAQKKLVLERVAAVPGVAGVVDRLRVRQTARVSDDGLLDRLRRRFAEDADFAQLRLIETEAGRTRLVRDVPEASGELELEVREGVVILNGAAPGLTCKRLAGVLAWRIAGVRDVVNGMAVEPPEEDAPILIEEAVRLALEKDGELDASQVRVGVRGATVRLTGLVRSAAARAAAEVDAWAVLGVDEVVDEIEIRP
jgi:osmotically-inducible protein OsmY